MVSMFGLVFLLGQSTQSVQAGTQAGLPRDMWIFVAGAVVALASAAITALISLVGIWLTHRFTAKREEKREKRKRQEEMHSKRQQVITQLRGAQGEATHLCRTYGETVSYFHVLQSSGKSAVAVEAMRECGMVLLAIGECHRRIYEALGLVSVLFPHTGQIEALISAIGPQLPPPPSPPEDRDLSLTELVYWGNKQAASFRGAAQSQYGHPIDKLLKYLKMQLETL